MTPQGRTTIQGGTLLERFPSFDIGPSLYLSVVSIILFIELSNKFNINWTSYLAARIHSDVIKQTRNRHGIHIITKNEINTCISTRFIIQSEEKLIQ